MFLAKTLLYHDNMYAMGQFSNLQTVYSFIYSLFGVALKIKASSTREIASLNAEAVFLTKEPASPNYKAVTETKDAAFLI